MGGKALVLSAGGMFGAYQAGAWEVLSERFKPDIVIGASIGSLNGWAIAGGCEPKELIERWLRFHDNSIRGIHDGYRPKIVYGVVVTDTIRLKPRLFTGVEVNCHHLRASCGAYPIQGRMYTDGGLFNPLPLWAAREMGATEILAIDVLPRWPIFRYPAPPPDLKAAVLEPKSRLGGLLASVRWTEANTRKWIDVGRADARDFLLKIKNIP